MTLLSCYSHLLKWHVSPKTKILGDGGPVAFIISKVELLNLNKDWWIFKG